MDRERVVRAVAGDRHAFTVLAVSARPSLHRTALRILRDPQAADDAVQETLVAAWLGLRRLRDPDRFEAWLHRLVVRASHRLARSERERSARMAAVGHRLHPGPVDDGLHLVAVRDQLQRAFTRLTARHRAVLTLRYYLDLRLGTAADVLGIPVGTARSRLLHAQRALRAAVDADERAWH